MFSAFALEGKLPFHPVYLALAIGFGSKLLPWMNDSGFWVVCKMSGQSAGETLRNHSTMFTIMGVVGFLLTLLSASIFPFKGTP
jgi:GntP family gluconate:H+ symporter